MKWKYPKTTVGLIAEAITRLHEADRYIESGNCGAWDLMQECVYYIEATNDKRLIYIANILEDHARDGSMCEDYDHLFDHEFRSVLTKIETGFMEEALNQLEEIMSHGWQEETWFQDMENWYMGMGNDPSHKHLSLEELFPGGGPRDIFWDWPIEDNVRDQFFDSAIAHKIDLEIFKQLTSKRESTEALFSLFSLAYVRLGKLEWGLEVASLSGNAPELTDDVWWEQVSYLLRLKGQKQGPTYEDIYAAARCIKDYDLKDGAYERIYQAQVQFGDIAEAKETADHPCLNEPQIQLTSEKERETVPLSNPIDCDPLPHESISCDEGALCEKPASYDEEISGELPGDCEESQPLSSPVIVEYKTLNEMIQDGSIFKEIEENHPCRSLTFSEMDLKQTLDDIEAAMPKYDQLISNDFIFWIFQILDKSKDNKLDFIYKRRLYAIALNALEADEGFVDEIWFGAILSILGIAIIDDTSYGWEPNYRSSVERKSTELTEDQITLGEMALAMFDRRFTSNLAR